MTEFGGPGDESAQTSDPLEALTKELRRQGRAAMAAQAAAEACLEILETGQGDRPGEQATRVPDAVTWLEALIPVFDTLDRAIAQAEGARHARRWTSLARPWSRADDSAPLARGLHLVREQLDLALERLGVSVDAPSSGRVDAERHRVVEVRTSGGGRPGDIVDLVRRGYALAGRIVREAEVIARR